MKNKFCVGEAEARGERTEDKRKKKRNFEKNNTRSCFVDM